MNINDIYFEAIEKWRRKNRGVGTIIMPPPLDDKAVVVNVLSKILSTGKLDEIDVFCDDPDQAKELEEYIAKSEIADTLPKDKLLNCYVVDTLSISFLSRRIPDMAVFYKVPKFSPRVKWFASQCKFKLFMYSRPITNNSLMEVVNDIAPIVYEPTQAVLDEARLSSPVKEMQIGITIPTDSEDWQNYKECQKYIDDSLNIFGNFEILQQAHMGNPALNISAYEICDQISKDNGWSEYLDMNSDYDVQIDKYYNPNAIRERASDTYNVIRARSAIVTDCKLKIDEIWKILQENDDKKFLIISKRSSFATHIADTINHLASELICEPYHNNLENIPAVDIDGNPIFYKSGKKVGERKEMGAKAQKTLYAEKLNRGLIRALSANNSPDKDLSVEIDGIIITSPLCEDVNTYRYRLPNCRFKTNKIQLYTLYCKDTTEEKKLERRNQTNNITVKPANSDDFFVED